ncbi:NTF2-related export protein-like [Teleopsis dalmanni]|uniref:NTF2-related export protein-like n=1 Tax=Teleopsis dalmanni TaxID=139649 RepID=UPI0018CF2F80|nr:NTF2-related export protein-like [Teleopsis dalmanni]
MDPALKEQMSHQIADSFTKSYYGAMDKSREKVIDFYMDGFMIDWNEEYFRERETAQDFLLHKTPESEHEITSIMPVVKTTEKVKGITSMSVNAMGNVHYKGLGVKVFYQDFHLVKMGNDWKIYSTILRD